MKKSVIVLGIIILMLLSCKNESNTHSNKIPFRKKPKNFIYTKVNTKEWLLKNKDNKAILNNIIAINRTDETNFKQMDSIIIPSDIDGDLAYYFPFPFAVHYLENINKIIFFSYPTQSFATYENGILMHTGPTNMGRENNKTPTGLFFTNWKAKKTTSTFNDEWELHWNFNIENKEGIGFHQYSLPGYPASHSCLRLQEKDAKYLYDWADQWVLADAETVKIKGTPVIIFGNYDFSAPKPWFQLLSNPKSLTLSESDIEKITKPYLKTILQEQKKRDLNKS